MPAKLDRCVADVKAKGGVDNPWAVCNASLNEEVAEAIGMRESHNALDIPWGREVPETVSIPGGLSDVSIGAKKKIGEIHVENPHDGRKSMKSMSENVLKQILETQLGECSCKNKSRSKH